MSRIGRQPITIPEGVTVQQVEDKIIISGPRGQLEQKIRPEIKVNIANQQVKLQCCSNSKVALGCYGLSRTLIYNKILGVTIGFSKILEIKGTGYRTSLEGGDLKILIGFSHPVIIKPPTGIQFQVEGTNIIKISGNDKQLVGQISAKIRAIRPPEPYKGKGIYYQGETIKRKAGKAAKTGATAGT